MGGDSARRALPHSPTPARPHACAHTSIPHMLEHFGPGASNCQRHGRLLRESADDRHNSIASPQRVSGSHHVSTWCLHMEHTPVHGSAMGRRPPPPAATRAPAGTRTSHALSRHISPSAPPAPGRAAAPAPATGRHAHVQQLVRRVSPSAPRRPPHRPKGARTRRRPRRSHALAPRSPRAHAATPATLPKPTPQRLALAIVPLRARRTWKRVAWEFVSLLQPIFS